MTLPPPPRFAPADIALFLDFDGTLVDLAERPDAVVVDAALTDQLARLVDRLDGRVALVSGRSVDQLDSLIGGAAKGVTIVGSHGAETRIAGGAIATVERPVSLDRAETLFRERYADRTGVVVEVKSLGVGLHYRLDPMVEAAANALATAFGRDHGLEVQKGKMMVELRVGGHDKGSGIEALMRMDPFAGHAPVFLGDDVTDEDGFVACASLGGHGILVGDDRPSAARHRLADVAAVRDWLVRL